MLLYTIGYRTLPKDLSRCAIWLSTDDSFSEPSTGDSGGVWGIDGSSAATTDPSELSAQQRKAWANEGTNEPAEPDESLFNHLCHYTEHCYRHSTYMAESQRRQKTLGEEGISCRAPLSLVFCSQSQRPVVPACDSALTIGLPERRCW